MRVRPQAGRARTSEWFSWVDYSEIRSRPLQAPASAPERGAEKLHFQCPAPKGASNLKEVTASLKRCPDTKPEFFIRLRRHCHSAGRTERLKACPDRNCPPTEGISVLSWLIDVASVWRRMRSNVTMDTCKDLSLQPYYWPRG
jgi:hypothetical protein